jgi:hypothetical protein
VRRRFQALIAKLEMDKTTLLLLSTAGKTSRAWMHLQFEAKFQSLRQALASTSCFSRSSEFQRVGEMVTEFVAGCKLRRFWTQARPGSNEQRVRKISKNFKAKPMTGHIEDCPGLLKF